MTITRRLIARREAALEEWDRVRSINVQWGRRARRRLRVWDWVLDAWTIKGRRAGARPGEKEVRSMGQQDRDRAEERAHGGIVHRDGDIATLGDGSQWWLNGTPWARAEADAVMVTTVHAPYTRSPALDHLRSRMHA